MLKNGGSGFGVVYIATDLSNNKQYVGQTVDFKRRIGEHLCGIRKKYVPLFERTLSSRGIGGFNFVQFTYPIDELDFWEIFWITKLNTTFPYGYNLTGGGKAPRGTGHPMYGKKHSEESKKKMSLSRLGEKNYAYGKHFSEEHRRKIGESNKGKFVSKETREKESIVQKMRFKLNPIRPGMGSMFGKKTYLGCTEENECCTKRKGLF